MTYSFSLPTKLVVSENAAQDLSQELDALPAGAVFLLSDQGILSAGLEKPIVQAMHAAGRQMFLYGNVPGNPNISDVLAALQVLDGARPAAIVGLGGGSVIDTAKAAGVLLAHPGLDWVDLQWGRAHIRQASLPVIALPTTAGTGSEVTHVAVIGDHQGFKKGVVHPAIFPRISIIDGSLMLSLPVKLTAATGVDAVVHALEAYLGRRANPTTDLFALGALQVLVGGLPEVTHNGANLPARREVALAATWAGIAMDQAGLGLCHALDGPLAAHHHVHHGLGNAVLLTATLDFNAAAIPAGRWEPLRAALGLPAAAQPAALPAWAQDFIRGLGLPSRLGEIGIGPDTIPAMAEEATRMAMIHNNPRPAGAADCRAVLEAAL
jgi:alcohol dehydrogenase class IV